MFERTSLERNFSSVRLSRAPRLNFSFCRTLTLTVLLLLCSLGLEKSLSAQSADTRSLDAYSAAIRQSVIASRIQGMEQFLQLAPDSRLREDAFEFLIWDYLRTGNRAEGVRRAQELIRADSSNPLAIAISADAGVGAQDPPTARLAKVKGALESLDSMRKPEGMADSEFRLLKTQTSAMLEGAAGLVSLELRDYTAARSYLTQAVNAAPENGRFVYGLALALLLDKNPDASKGYWYLARAVNLTRGTQAGDQISAFARERYQQDGGNDSDWGRFLTATAGPNQHSGANTGKSAATASLAQHGSIPKTQAIATNLPVKPDSTLVANASEERTEWPRSTTTSAQSGLKPVPQNAPVSLGILIQTGLLTGQNRREIIDTLRVITRNLRPDDEAFIMAFSNQLDFEQDLTANNVLLEEALSALKPSSGAALFDGVMFAAGHLNRIGKNQNRTLLVISDGRDTTKHDNTAPLTAQLRNVRIDCIGLDVSGAEERDLLQRLAAYSGGKASFASDPHQFRAAAGQVAQTIGIDFQN
jgi:tetratricopeptide (TPR) repeat protein